MGVNAQSLTLPGLAGGGGDSESQNTERDPQEFLRSLDEVIATLENDQRREELVANLKELRQAAGEAEGGEGEASPEGLLGALAETVSDLGQRAESGRSPLDIWQQQLRQAWLEVETIARDTGHAETFRLAVEAAVMLGIWVALLLALIAASRLLARRREWPLMLPREPRTWWLVVHFLRRLSPWLLAFALMLALAQFIPSSPGRTLALVVAYIALCGRLLSLICETVFSVFTRGHRYTAVTLLRRQALRRLFAIGALVALADALDSSRLTELLGDHLAGLVAVFANALAALLSGGFILRYKRHVKHLIRNRPYSQRKQRSTSYDVIRVLGGLWHIPAMLMVVASLVAIFVSVGNVGDALTRAIICSALLVLTFVVTGLIRRHGELITRRRRISQYRKRLERFGYTLAHILCWVVFAELSLRVWGASLLGVGSDAASARIGQALLAIGFTVLLAWLAWIFADTAIQRALMSSTKARGRRVNSARAQTITPLIRNVIFATIVVIAAIVGLANLGVNVTPLLAGAGVIGLAIGFGAQTLVQDLITGMFILIEDSLAIDDFVDLGGHMGTVEGLTLRTVRLRDLDGVVHIITFSQITSIHNMSRQFGIALMKVRIPHAMKIDDAVTLMREVAEDLRQDPVMRHHIWSPLEMQGVESFEDGAAILRMRMRTAPVMQWDVARAFNLRVKQRLEADGLEMAMPRLSLHMESQGGDQSAAGDEAADDGHDASGRRPGEAGVADPRGDTSSRGGSPDPAPSQ
nr:mechanosensitive ion channel family protein [Aidingimonas lacisalsi]